MHSLHYLIYLASNLKSTIYYRHIYKQNTKWQIKYIPNHSFTFQDYMKRTNILKKQVVLISFVLSIVLYLPFIVKAADPIRTLEYCQKNTTDWPIIGRSYSISCGEGSKIVKKSFKVTGKKMRIFPIHMGKSRILPTL